MPADPPLLADAVLFILAELAYATSAVFWCVFGAMLMLFALGLLQTLPQLHRRQRQ